MKILVICQEELFWQIAILRLKVIKMHIVQFRIHTDNPENNLCKNFGENQS